MIAFLKIFVYHFLFKLGVKTKQITLFMILFIFKNWQIRHNNCCFDLYMACMLNRALNPNYLVQLSPRVTYPSITEIKILYSCANKHMKRNYERKNRGGGTCQDCIFSNLIFQDLRAKFKMCLCMYLSSAII